MLIFKILGEACISIKSSKLRTALTVLGIIIGIASVVVMVSVGEATQNKVDEYFSSLGANKLIIMPARGKAIGGIKKGRVKTLTYEDANAIKKIPFVNEISYYNNASSQLIYKNNNIDGTICGTQNNYFSIMNLVLKKGSLFSDTDLNTGALVAIIGNNINSEFFPNSNGLGKTIRLGSTPVKIIGILNEKGSSFGSSEDDQVYIPFKTFSKRIMVSKFPKSVNMVVLNVKNKKYLSYVEETVEKLLKMRHKISDSQTPDFDIRNLQSIIDTVKSTTALFNILLCVIASISLIVGSIGIMNMMLVNITERTKEIGLRKAVGAKRKDILFQFLFEAILISFIGSMIGLLFGIGISQILTPILKIPVPISGVSVVVSVAVSILVGISSGLFPAIKAAKLDPIVALQYE